MQDIALPSWLPRLTASAGPRFIQIADALQEAIAAGELKVGDRLPPQRQLAKDLRVDLTTVTRAYDEAKRRHLLEGRGVRGTYVAAPKVELSTMLDLSMNIPPPPEGVDFADLLKIGLSQVLMRANNELLMTYQLSGGSPSDRHAGAAWLEPMFGRVKAEEIVVCPGAQAAIAAFILALTEPRDVILAETMAYSGVRTAATQFGRRIVSVISDEDGMVPAALEEACVQHNARLVYLNPTLQNPTTVTMSQKRREDLAAVAKRFGARIVEDDPYWLYASAPPRPIAALGSDHIYYISTLSKCLTPGLRIAFVLIRNLAERERFLVALRSFAQMAGPLTAALATQWIHDGSAAALLEGVLKETRLRQRMAQTFFPSAHSRAREGLHVWLDLPSYWNPHQLARAADKVGLVVTPADIFATEGTFPNAIRISLGSIMDRARLHVGLGRLSLLLTRRPESLHDAVV
jgi:DNA-binding transcriptional MocR family regulator